MNKKVVRGVASAIILTVTAVLFVRYLQSHPAYITQLKDTNPWWIFGILIADFGGVIALAFLSLVMIYMTGKRIGTRENLLLTIYSSIANFFGPLQSGPGVRAAYLKAKHQVSLRAYFLVSLISYAVFAITSAFMLFIGTRPWWQAILACVAAGVVSYAVLHMATRKKDSVTLLKITPRFLTLIVLFTLVQIAFIGTRYYLALRATGVDVSLGQLISYTGAANFALFVSITPDGIGIREAFLFFAQQIHGVSTHAIVAANLIDRATYVVFLGLLFGLALALHARSQIRAFISNQATAESDETTLH